MEAAVNNYNSSLRIDGTLAYDLPMAGGAERVGGRPASLPLPKERVREKPPKRVKAKHNVSAFAAVGYVTITVLLMLLIFSYVRLYEISAESSVLTSKLNSLKKDQAGLLAQYEGLIDLKEIETRAKNEIGMSKPRDGQVIYVDLSNPDEAVLAEGQGTQRLLSVLEAFKESITYVKAYFE